MHCGAEVTESSTNKQHHLSMKRRIYIYYLLRESEHKKVYVCHHISYGCVSILSMQRAYVKVRRYRCIAIDSKA